MIADVIAIRGFPAKLRRQSARSDVWFEVDLIAAVLDAKPQMLIDGVVQYDRVAWIGNREIAAKGWPGPPLPGDLLTNADGEFSVISCETDRMGDQILRHLLTVRGL